MSNEIDRRGVLLAGSGGAFGLYSWAADAAPPVAQQKNLLLKRVPRVRPRNILVVLTDDHRYDAMGFMKAQDFGETPTLDRLAREGVHFRNAFVTTALCSPSRASLSPATDNLAGLPQSRNIRTPRPAAPDRASRGR